MEQHSQPTSYPSLSTGPEIVAIPGPSVMPGRVLAAMSQPMPDIYDGELIDVIDEVYERLPTIAGTSQKVFVAIGNGHAGWEMALANTCSAGDRVLVANCGIFARVWAEMAEFNGLTVEIIDAPAGRAVDPGLIEEHLRADTERQIRAVLTVQTDTATSVRNDIPAIRSAIDAADHPALLMVDCIASMGCERFEMDAWGVDVTIAASQKGLMTPPGVTFVWAGERALAAHRDADLRTLYWDWTYRSQDGPYYLRFCGTPPVSHLYGLREALRMIAEEGLENRWARHVRHADAVRAAVEAWSTPGGLGLLASHPSERSHAVTTVLTGSVDASALGQLARYEHGVTLGLGIGGHPSGSFRIGHMGYVSDSMVTGVLGVIETALGRLDAPLAGSGVAAAIGRLRQPSTP